MYKVFYYHKLIILAGMEEEIAAHHGDTRLAFKDQATLQEKVEEFMKKEAIGRLLVYAHDKEVLRRAFFASYTSMIAAGGLVFNDYSQLLLIKRFGLWDFPKGKVEKNEAVANSAVREVEEETGIRAEISGQEPLLTYHIYHQKAKTILKTTFWYEMRSSGHDALKPQHEEQIEEVVWIPLQQAEAYLANSYASLQDLLSRYLKKSNPCQ